MSVWSMLRKILVTLVLPPKEGSLAINFEVLCLLLWHWERLMDMACEKSHNFAQAFWRRIVLEIIQYDFMDLDKIAHTLNVDSDFLWSLLGKDRETYQLPWELVGHLMALHDEIRPDLQML